MTDKQVLFIIRKLTNPNVDVRRIEYNANYNPPDVRFGFYDQGGNWHSVGILPDGKLRTYDERWDAA